MVIFGKMFSRKPEKYSSEWISSLSDEQWKEEREEVRQRHCKGDEEAWDILGRFDDDWRRRKDDGEPWTPPAHREHGWYLPNDHD